MNLVCACLNDLESMPWNIYMFGFGNKVKTNNISYNMDLHATLQSTLLPCWRLEVAQADRRLPALVHTDT